MKNCNCAVKKTEPLTKRAFTASGWLVPGVMLAVLPKCPLCLAAYVAMGTGIGLSFSTASYLRILLIVSCVAALLFLAIRSGRQYLRKRLLSGVKLHE